MNTERKIRLKMLGLPNLNIIRKGIKNSYRNGKMIMYILVTQTKLRYGRKTIIKEENHSKILRPKI